MTISSAEKNKRIAKNTFLLYIRMIVLMLVSLYTSRVILNALGIQDFGIYNVVGGVVSMFSVLSNSLSAAIMRFLTYQLGRDNKKRLQQVFSTSINIQIILCVIITILLESVGLWFLNEKMVIPDNRIVAANWVYQLSIIAFCINLISVPYNALIIAYEKMTAFAYISIIEAVLKLGVAISVVYILSDKLIIYAILMALVSLVIRFTYGFYCKREFPECTYHLYFDKKLLKEMSSFAGWNFLGSSSVILRDQGGNILLNLFCGPIVNAARGISFQVSNAVNSFVQNFQTAFNPQITKSYAIHDFEYLRKLTYSASKVSAFLIIVLGIPLFIEMPTVLKLWLKIVPDHAIWFVRLSLIFLFFEALAKPMVTAVLATGNIKNFQIITGGIQLLNIPISYILLREGMLPEVVIIVAVIISFASLILKNYYFTEIINIKGTVFYNEVFLRISLITLIVFIPSLLIYEWLLAFPVIRFISVCFISMALSFLGIYNFGLNNSEKSLLKKILKHHSK